MRTWGRGEGHSTEESEGNEGSGKNLGFLRYLLFSISRAVWTVAWTASAEAGDI
jgi:hypothetical protein